MTSKGLNPDCWGAVLQFVGARMRFELAHHCPDLDRFTRNIPMRIDTFVFNFDEFQIDDCCYQFNHLADNRTSVIVFLHNKMPIRYFRVGNQKAVRNDAISHLLKDKGRFGVINVNKFVYGGFGDEIPEWMKLVVRELHVEEDFSFFLYQSFRSIVNDPVLNPLDELCFRIYNIFGPATQFDYPLMRTAKSLSIKITYDLPEYDILLILNLKRPKVHLSFSNAKLTNAKMIFIIQQWIQNPPNMGDVMTIVKRLTPGLKQLIKAIFQTTEGAIEEYHNKELYLRPTICIKVGEESQLMIYETKKKDEGRMINLKMVKME